MLEQIFLNCVNATNYEIIEQKNFVFDRTYYFLISGFSMFGIIFNSISVFIFTFSKNSSTKFLKFLKYYSFSSLAISWNDFLYSIIYLSSNLTVYSFDIKINTIDKKIQGHEKETVSRILVIYMNIWAFLYTFSGILDIFIVYERIQIYLPDLKFLRNKTAGIISLGVLLYSFAINIPVGIARTTYHNRISIESEDPIDIYSFGLRKFKYNDIFLLSVFLSNFIRDIISFLIEIILNIILIVTMTRYYKRRLTINVQNPNSFAFRCTDMNNSKIALFMNFISALFHMATFSLIILLRYLSFDVYASITLIVGLIFTFRHSLNLFLFLKLNKKFRRNFYVLIPECFKIKFKKRRIIAPQLMILESNKINNTNKEHINLQSIITYL